jgi:hypothetical protein
MPTAAAILGGSALTAGASIFGANSAAKAQTDAANAAIAAQTQMFNTAKGEIQPFVDFGTGTLPTLSKLLSPGDASAALSDLPGFKFANLWGEKAITNQATSRGLGGNALKAGADYAEGLAGQQTFFPYINALMGGAALGSSAASSLGGMAVNTGQGIGSARIGAGNAQAGADVSIGNAVGGLGSSIGNYALFNALTNNFGKGNAGAWARPLATDQQWPG